MAALEKRGQYWRARTRRKRFPDQSRGFDTRVEAEMWARAIKSDTDRGLCVDRTEAEKNLLADLIDRYLREVTPSKRGAGRERSRLLALQRRPIAQIKIAAPPSTHIASYRDDLLMQVSAGTVNKELNHLARVIETGRPEWSIQLPENPALVVRRPPPPKSRDRRFRQGEEDWLRQAMLTARNPFVAPVVDLAIETGMRQGEVVGLVCQHIDLNHRVAHLPLTKNGEARAVPRLSKAGVVLATLKPADVDEPTGPVSSGVTVEAVKRAFIRAFDPATLDDFHFHNLCHGATSRLFEKGLSPMEVAIITAHKTLQMLKRYTHLNARDLEAKVG